MTYLPDEDEWDLNDEPCVTILFVVEIYCAPSIVDDPAGNQGCNKKKSCLSSRYCFSTNNEIRAATECVKKERIHIGTETIGFEPQRSKN